MQCACESCQYTVNPGEAIAEDGQYYRCGACSNGHSEGTSGGKTGLAITAQGFAGSSDTCQRIAAFYRLSWAQNCWCESGQTLGC
ncbi:MAG: hypothetical protein AAF722_21905 [Cyanobacteria bacterium P01_C01_bin.70]